MVCVLGAALLSAPLLGVELAEELMVGSLACLVAGAWFLVRGGARANRRRKFGYRDAKRARTKACLAQRDTAGVGGFPRATSSTRLQIHRFLGVGAIPLVPAELACELLNQGHATISDDPHRSFFPFCHRGLVVRLRRRGQRWGRDRRGPWRWRFGSGRAGRERRHPWRFRGSFGSRWHFNRRSDRHGGRLVRRFGSDDGRLLRPVGVPVR